MHATHSRRPSDRPTERRVASFPGIYTETSAIQCYIRPDDSQFGSNDSGEIEASKSTPNADPIEDTNLISVPEFNDHDGVH